MFNAFKTVNSYLRLKRNHLAGGELHVVFVMLIICFDVRSLTNVRPSLPTSFHSLSLEFDESDQCLVRAIHLRLEPHQ